MKILSTLLTVCLSVFCFFQALAQTSILPVIGLDILRVNSMEINPASCRAQTSSTGCIEEGFQFSYPFIGLRLENSLYQKIKVFYQINYTQKNYQYTIHIHGFSSSIIGEAIRFNQFSHELGVSFTFRNFFIDLGGLYASYRDIKFTHVVYGLEESEFASPYNIGHKNYFGYTAGIGYELNRFQLRLAVHQSFRHSENVKWNSANTDATPTAISLSAGYRFQLLDKIRLGGRKKGCPTF